MGLADLLVGAGTALEGKVAELFAPRAADSPAPADPAPADGSSDDDESSSEDGEAEAEARTGAGSGGAAAGPAAPAKDDPAKLARTVFVGNVSTSTTSKALKRVFRECGKVESMRVRSVAFANKKMSRKGAVISKSFDSERKQTYNAYVVFASAESVPAALGKNGSELDGKTLRVDRATPPKIGRAADKGAPADAPLSGAEPEYDRKRSVFVGNMPFDAQEQPLREHFASCGAIEGVRVVRDAYENMGKGFGYLLFAERAGVERALKLHESEFAGRKLRVFRCLKAGEVGAGRGGGGRGDGGRGRGRGAPGIGGGRGAAPAEGGAGKVKRPRTVPRDAEAAGKRPRLSEEESAPFERGAGARHGAGAERAPSGRGGRGGRGDSRGGGRGGGGGGRGRGRGR